MDALGEKKTTDKDAVVLDADENQASQLCHWHCQMLWTKLNQI